MKFFSRLVRRQFILQLVAYGVFANGLLIMITSLLELLVTRNGMPKISSVLSSLPLLLGLTLVYLATLLRRRKYAAWLVVLPVYAFIFANNLGTLLVKENHRHLAIVSALRNIVVPAIVVYGLIRYRAEFKVQSDIQNFKLAVRTSLLVILLAGAYGVVGFRVLDEHDFHQEIGVVEAVHRTVDQFDFTTDKELVPYSRRSKLFIDSLSVLSTGAVVYAFLAFFQPLRARLSDQSRNREQLKRLLEAHKASSEDFFKLWPQDKLYYFNWQHTAAVAYHVYHGIALVVGDPAGKQRDFPALLNEFSDFCRLNDWQPAFIHTEPTHSNLYLKQDFNLQKIGEEAILNLDHYIKSVHDTKYFRQIRTKFTKQGYTTELLTPPHNQAVLQRLGEISSDWLTLPGREERTFMMGYFSPPYMQQCSIMVLRDAAGTIQAFINQVPSFDTSEANYDLLRQTKHALANSNDFILMSFIEHLVAQGFKTLNMGLCPLAGLDNNDQDRTVIDSTLKFVYANGDRFYSFSGLHKFKAKYDPEWSSRYIAYKGGVRGFTRALNGLNKLMNKVK